MTGKNHLALGKFYIVLLTTSLLILFASIEALILAKDGEMFLQWAGENFPNDLPDNLLFIQYVSSNLSIYFLKIMIPSSIAVTAFLTATRTRFTGIMVYIWVILSFGGLAFTTADMNLKSVFFYVNVLLYTGLIFYIYFIIGISRDGTGGEN